MVSVVVCAWRNPNKERAAGFAVDLYLNLDFFPAGLGMLQMRSDDVEIAWPSRRCYGHVLDRVSEYFHKMVTSQRKLGAVLTRNDIASVARRSREVSGCAFIVK